jgi:hypothetical protein
MHAFIGNFSKLEWDLINSGGRADVVEKQWGQQEWRQQDNPFQVSVH